MLMPLAAVCRQNKEILVPEGSCNNVSSHVALQCYEFIHALHQHLHAPCLELKEDFHVVVPQVRVM